MHVIVIYDCDLYIDENIIFVLLDDECPLRPPARDRKGRVDILGRSSESAPVKVALFGEISSII